MVNNISSRESTAIINAISAGVVPKIGSQHLAVGRTHELVAFTQSLKDIEQGQSIVKFIVADYGIGKSFLLQLYTHLALNQGFLVSTSDFSNESRLYSNNGHAVQLYKNIINNISSLSRPQGGALSFILDKWLNQIISNYVTQNNIDISDVFKDNSPHTTSLKNLIFNDINQINGIGSLSFNQVLITYFEGFVNKDEDKQKKVLKWIQGEFSTKSEAYQELGVREIVHDKNIWEALQNLTKLVVAIGYKGLIINLDEMTSLYRISNVQMREKNYEQLLNLINRCYQGNIENVMFNFATTPEVIYNERKGLFSYAALKTRLKPNAFSDNEKKDYTQPIIELSPLIKEEIFLLLSKIHNIFKKYHEHEIDFLNNDEIRVFIENIYNQKPDSQIFINQREIIRSFSHLLTMIRQYPKDDKKKWLDSLKTL